MVDRYYALQHKVKPEQTMILRLETDRKGTALRLEAGSEHLEEFKTSPADYHFVNFPSEEADRLIKWGALQTRAP